MKITVKLNSILKTRQCVRVSSKGIVLDFYHSDPDFGIEQFARDALQFVEVDDVAALVAVAIAVDVSVGPVPVIVVILLFSVTADG